MFVCVNVQLECKLSDLQNQYSVKVSEKDALQEKCEEITTQLGRAEVLTTSLGDEQVRICGNFTFIFHNNYMYTRCKALVRNHIHR